MPKQNLRISSFEGGVNTSASERSLPEGQSPLATNADISSIGSIKTMGNAKSNNIAFYDPTGVADPGYGLFTFNHDYDMLDPATGSLKASPAATPTSYLMKATGSGIAIYDYTNKVWYDSGGSLGVTNIITFDDGNANASNILPIFYIVDGAVRVCDAQHPHEKVKWFGFINRTLFGNANTTYPISKWYSTDANIWNTAILSDPSNYSVTNGGTSAWPDDGATINKPLQVFYSWDENDASLATFNTGRIYTIYATMLYDGIKQESNMQSLGSIGAPTTNAKLNIGVTIDNIASWNSRIRGVRIYISDSLDAWGAVYHLLEVDFVRGVKKAGSPAYEKNWYYDSGNAAYWSEASLDQDNCFVFDDMPVGNTYDSQNGHYPSEETKAGFKCATVIGRRVYIGNITEQDGNAHTVASSITSGDAMLKSPGNAFDKFPTLNKVEAVVNDGDEIVALHNFGGKLLQFKKKSLYILDVSGDIESLAGQFDYVGVSKPYHIVSTPIGVFWINNLGLYWYGQEGGVQNLITNKLSLKTWDFGEYASLGYDALNKKLIIAKDIRADSATTNYRSKDVILFDLTHMSFMFGMDVIDGGPKTNFVNAPDGKAIYAIDGSASGYAKINLSSYDLTYSFYGTLAKYNTSYATSKWEYEAYPWKLFGGTAGVKGMDPLGAVETNVVVWDDTKHLLSASADQWKEYGGGATVLTTMFEKGERYDITDSLISGMNRTWVRGNNATNTGENNYSINITPVGKIETGSQMNAMRGYAEDILTDASLTWDDIITGTTGGPYTKDIDRGDGTSVTWTLTIDTWGDGEINDVAFHLSVSEPFNSANFRLIGGSLMEWSDQPADTSDFLYYTRDMDFNNPAQEKSLSKVYVTFQSLSSKDAADDLAVCTPSNVLARIHVKTVEGEYTMDIDPAESTNYDATTGLTATTPTSGMTTAALVPNDEDINSSPKTVPNKILSAQLVLYTDEGKKTPGGFVISDITFSYRLGSVK